MNPLTLLALTAPYPIPPRETRRGFWVRWSLWSARALTVAILSLFSWSVSLVASACGLAAVLGLIALALCAAALAAPLGIAAFLLWRAGAIAAFRARLVAGTSVEA